MQQWSDVILLAYLAQTTMWSMPVCSKLNDAVLDFHSLNDTK